MMSAKSADPSETGVNWASQEVAERWSRQQAHRNQIYGPATDLMLELADIEPGHRVLDVAAGTGDQTLMAARRAGPSGYVLATDRSAAMLNRAADAAREAGLTNIETRVMDAESLDLDARSFDTIICRLGLMFFPNALQEMHRVLRPGGKISALVFSTAERNPFQGVPLGIVGRSGNKPASLFALGQPGVLRNAFSATGFSDVTVHVVSAQRHSPSTEDVIRRLKNANFLREPMAKLSDIEREQAWMDIERELRRFEVPNGCEIPAELLIGIGTK